jgi:hypothetical protein
MARNSTRRVSKHTGKGIFGRVYAPLYHLLEAGRNVGKSAMKRTGSIVDNGLGFAQNTGVAVTKHANMAVRNITSRRNRKNKSNSRRNRRNRKTNSRQ